MNYLCFGNFFIRSTLLKLNMLIDNPSSLIVEFLHQGLKQIIQVQIDRVNLWSLLRHLWFNVLFWDIKFMLFWSFLSLSDAWNSYLNEWFLSFLKKTKQCIRIVLVARFELAAYVDSWHIHSEPSWQGFSQLLSLILLFPNKFYT